MSAFGVDERDWRSPRELRDRLRDAVDIAAPGGFSTLEIEVAGERVTVTGVVHSEEVRGIVLRLLATLLDDQSIDDRLEVVGVFEPASDEEWFIPPTASPQYDEGPSGPGGAAGARTEEVRRHPHLSTADELEPGSVIHVVVDLATTPQEPGQQPIKLADVEPGWHAIDVDVIVTSSACREGSAGIGTVVVREDGGSTAATVTLALREDLEVGSRIEATAVFSHGGRYCGRRSVTLGTVHAQGPRDRASTEGEPPVSFDLKATPPAMSVHVFTQGRGLMWTWTLAPGVAAPNRPSFAMSDLLTGPAEFARGLIETCPEIDPDDVRRRMGSIGERIWSAAPTVFRDTYLHVLAATGPTFPIQFILDDFNIPWEMMRPPEGDHLYLTHPVARWTAHRAERVQALPNGTKTSFVPQYDAGGTLPAALEEQQWLRENLEATAAVPTKPEFLRNMGAGDDVPRTSLIHFAGHGSAASNDAEATLKMQDKPINLQDVDERSTKLGDRDRSVVVLNACEAGTTKAGLAWAEGWAPVLAKRGFGAIVAPMWRVKDRAACTVVTSGLDGLYLRSLTLGEAFTTARAASADASAAAYAFLTYGDVMARISS